MIRSLKQGWKGRGGSEGCNRWEGQSRASGVWPATTKKREQDVSKMTLYPRACQTHQGFIF